MKITIPRNRSLPDPSIADIILSKPKELDSNGNPLGFPLTLYQGNDINLPRAGKLVEGMIFWYHTGMVYLPKYPSYSDMYAGFAKESAMIGIGKLIPEVFEKVVGESSERLEELIEKGIEGFLFPEEEESLAAYEREVEAIAADLVKKGAVCLSWVQLVEIKHQTVPRFLRKPEQHFIFTFEKLTGERLSYGFSIPSSDSQDPAILGFLSSRVMCEFNSLISQVKSEQVDEDSLAASVNREFQDRYGDKIGEHTNEMINEFFRLSDAELERKGFNERVINAEVFRRIAPLVPYYRQIPRFQAMVLGLEYTAAGRKEELNSIPLNDDLSSFR